MNESTFAGQIKKSLLAEYPGIIYQKHSDRFTAGIADAEIVWRGMTTWIEYKVLPKTVNKEFPLIGNKHYQLKPLQYKFLMDRISAGIRGYVIIATDISHAIIISPHLVEKNIYPQYVGPTLIKIKGIWKGFHQILLN